MFNLLFKRWVPKTEAKERQIVWSQTQESRKFWLGSWRLNFRSEKILILRVPGCELNIKKDLIFRRVSINPILSGCRVNFTAWNFTEETWNACAMLLYSFRPDCFLSFLLPPRPLIVFVVFNNQCQRDVDKFYLFIIILYFSYKGSLSVTFWLFEWILQWIFTHLKINDLCSPKNLGKKLFFKLKPNF